MWKKRLKSSFDVSAEELIKLDAEYGQFLGQQVREFIEQKGVKKIDFIASHGHTVFHQPEAYFTLQIGNGAHIAAETGIKVIADFRVQDVALGGQGAPLVPIGVAANAFRKTCFRHDEGDRTFPGCIKA